VIIVDMNRPPRWVPVLKSEGWDAVHWSSTPATALRLARYFRTTPDFWLNLQPAYDLKIIQREMGQTIEKEVKERNAA
jgi:hypothetical protein